MSEERGEPGGPSEGELEQRERELARRESALEQRERQLDTRASEPPPSSAEDVDLTFQGKPPPPASPGELPAAGWGPARTLGALAVFLVAVIIEATIVAGIDPGIDTLAARITLQALLAATLVIVAFAFARPGRGFAAPAVLGLRRSRRSPFWPAVGAYLGYIVCALVVAALLEPEQEDVTRELGVDEGVAGSIAAGFLIIAIAPVTEEIFFRGFIFAGVRRAAPFAIASLLSAAIWGLFHYTGPGSLGVVVQLAVFGIALAWLYERTGSLWPAIAVHALNNAIAFAILTA